MFPNEIIRASAGTGKTFQLSNRLIGLAAAGEPVEHALSATFARKAAGEILERVMLRLAEAAGDAETARILAAHVGDASLDQTRCRSLLRDLIRNLHRLRIGTLDSFFAQLTGCYSLELGLPPGWRIVEATVDQAIRIEAIRNLLDEETTGDVVTLIRLMSKGEIRRSVSGEISSVVNGLYSLFRETDRSAWNTVPRRGLLENDVLDAAVQNVRELQFTNKNYIKARDANAASAEAGDWSGFISKGYAASITSGSMKFYGKDVPDDVVAAYCPLIEHAKAVLVNNIAARTSAVFDLLEKFESHYEKLKLSRRALRFNDVAFRLAEGVAGLDVDRISHRLDAHLEHLLLDEFQDTSLVQWAVLKPLAARINHGRGRSFFCVGDVKQAIYGWRGGVSEVFDAVGDVVGNLETRGLNQSFRSSQPVIDTVNHVFSRIADASPLDGFPDVARVWTERFEPHTTARTELAGFTRLVTTRLADDGEKQSLVTLACAAQEVARLHAAHPGMSIGVLVRRNEAVARLIYELRNKHRVPASEEGGNPLVDSAVVVLVLSLFRLADHPGDGPARYHVANSPLGGRFNFADHTDHERGRELSQEIRAALVFRGYGRFVYELARDLAPDCDERELRRLLQLVELAWRWDDEATLRSDDFIEFVENTKVEDPTSADVRVMTVHQAKGLQFDVVVLPELDVDLKGRPPPVVVGRMAPTGPVDRVCAYASDNEQPLLPDGFQQMFRGWENEVVNESLCLLYVAMTRAVHALHMIIAPTTPVKSSKGPTFPKTFASVLRSTLVDDDPVDPETDLYVHGDTEWDEDGRQAASDPNVDAAGMAKPAESVEVRLAPGTGRRTRGLDRKSPSGLEGGSTVRLEHRLRLNTEAATARGSLLHAWFEQIEWLDEGVPSNEELLNAVRTLPPGDLDFEAELTKFHELLTRPVIRAALLRETYETSPPSGVDAALAEQLRAGVETGEIELTVHREHPFAVRDGDALLRGFIDRMVLFRQNGRPVFADVVDFKSDALAPGVEGAVNSRVEYYRPQLEAYRRAVMQQLHLAADRISTRLLFLEPAVMTVVRGK